MSWRRSIRSWPYRDSLRVRQIYLLGSTVVVGLLACKSGDSIWDFGPGYRLYFGRDGGQLIILLVGGSKSRQQRDIETAQAYWDDYKRRKRSIT